ncbi:unnamed protein product [Arabis nemorensis]|uniref:Separase n=1 Tax=Arabis nemorensis TaxID=586526 RepID=A0A565C251_9BRAS|nr:unnamed protein product [Arabis nemorensis]
MTVRNFSCSNSYKYIISGKCLAKSGKVHQAHEAILRSIAVLFNSNISSHSSISLGPLLDFIGKEIKGDVLGVDRARILYNLCKLSLQTYHSRASRSICCDLSHIPSQKLVSWLTLAFVLSREVPILYQKISRLLAALYLLSSSSAEFSFPCDGELSVSHWVTYYHQVSLGAHMNYQFLSSYSRRYKSGRNSDKEASRLRCMASAEFDFLRLAPESTEDLVKFAKNFFNSLSESTVICISVLGGTLSKLLQKIMKSPPVCAWLLLSRLSSKSQPVAVLLPVDSVLEEGSDDDDSNPSNIEVNGIKEMDKRWVCPWGDVNLRRKKREQLNLRLAKFLRKLEDLWLGPWRHLLLGESSNSKLHESTQKKLVKELRSKCNMEVNETLLKVFLGNGTNGFEGDAWISQLCLKNGCYIGRRDHIDEGDGCAFPTSASYGPQTVLMGCSSGLPYRRSGRYVPNSVPTSLLLAGSPVIVANLWDVTSDINCFGKAMLEGWFRERSDDCTSSERVGSFMADARDACTMQFLTGAAPTKDVPSYENET